LALVLFAGTAFALNDGGLDASNLDGGSPDVGAPETGVIDGASDATSDATTDATTTDGASDASDGSAIKDAKSDVCDPNVEPCTVRADTGTDNDAGDVEEPASTDGCSCNSAPAAASLSPFLLLLAGLALLRRKR
jgi:MYXO-CTERM domain-containing protein